MAINPLTREQKLIAEIAIQLGNIAEAINNTSGDPSSLKTKIQELQTELTSAAQERSELSNALALSNAKVSELQTSLTTYSTGDTAITPDTINEVMSNLGINHDTV